MAGFTNSFEKKVHGGRGSSGAVKCNDGSMGVWRRSDERMEVKVQAGKVTLLYIESEDPM